MFDLGIMEQVFWNTSHGRLLTESVNMAHPMSRFWNGRWELIYLPVSLVHRLFPLPETGLIVQTIALALGAIPIYWMTRDRFGNGMLTVVLPMTYLLYPPLHNANLFDIHGITFATPVFLFTYYYLRQRSWPPFFLCTVLLLSCREDASFLVFMLGLYALFVMKTKKVGVTVVFMAVFWFLLCRNVQYFRPFFNLPVVQDPNTAPGIWGALGGPSPVSFLTTVLGNPNLLLTRILDLNNGKLLIKMLAPVGFLPLFSPTTLIIMLPNLALNMISSSSVLRNINHHYTSAITPVVFVSLILGLANLREYVAMSWERSRVKGFFHRFLKDVPVSIFLLCTSILTLMLWSNALTIDEWKPKPHYRVIDEVIKMIPENASLSTHFYIAPHVAHRENLFLFPDRVGEAQYVIYDLSLPYNRLMSHKSQANPAVIPLNEYLLSLFHNREYGIVMSQDGVIIFKKGANYEEGVRTFARTERRWVVPPLSKAHTGDLSLVGVSREGVVGYRKKYLHFVLSWEFHGSQRFDGSTVSFLLTGKGTERIIAHEPLFGLLQRREWSENELIRDDLYLPISDLGTGEYLLSLIPNHGGSNRSSAFPVLKFTVMETLGV